MCIRISYFVFLFLILPLSGWPPSVWAGKTGESQPSSASSRSTSASSLPCSNPNAGGGLVENLANATHEVSKAACDQILPDFKQETHQCCNTPEAYDRSQGQYSWGNPFNPYTTKTPGAFKRRTPPKEELDQTVITPLKKAIAQNEENTRQSLKRKRALTQRKLEKTPRLDFQIRKSLLQDLEEVEVQEKRDSAFFQADQDRQIEQATFDFWKKKIAKELDSKEINDLLESAPAFNSAWNLGLLNKEDNLETQNPIQVDDLRNASKELKAIFEAKQKEHEKAKQQAELEQVKRELKITISSPNRQDKREPSERRVYKPSAFLPPEKLKAYLETCTSSLDSTSKQIEGWTELARGGASIVYKFKMDGKEYVAKARKTHGDIPFSKGVIRDEVLGQKFKEDAESFKVEGKPLVRVAEYQHPELFKRGIGIQLFVPGPTALQIGELVNSGNETKLKELGFDTLEEAQKKIKALEAFYQITAPKTLALSKENKFPELRNNFAKGDYSHVPVGYDYNHGQNVIWSNKEKMFVAIDY